MSSWQRGPKVGRIWGLLLVTSARRKLSPINFVLFGRAHLVSFNFFAFRATFLTVLSAGGVCRQQSGDGQLIRVGFRRVNVSKANGIDRVQFGELASFYHNERVLKIQIVLGANNDMIVRMRMVCRDINKSTAFGITKVENRIRY